MFKKHAAKRIKLDISYSAIFKVLAVAFLIVFLYLVRDVVLVLFVAFIISSAIMPAVNGMQNRGVPRFLGVLLMYLVLISLIILAIILAVPPITEQLGQLASSLPTFYHKVDIAIQNWGLNVNGSNLGDIIESSWASIMSGGRTVFNTLGGVVGALFAVVLSLVIAFYMSVQKDSLQRLAVLLSPKKKREYVKGLIARIQEKLGAWLKGQLVLCLVVGVLAYIGLLILGVKYALILAVIVAITEIVPYIGPFVGAVPAILIALTQSPILALFTIILYVLIQQIENAFITPNIMRKAVGLNPIITIAAISAGGTLAGIGGAIIAIPLAATLSILLKDAWEYKQKISAKK